MPTPFFSIASWECSSVLNSGLVTVRACATFHYNGFGGDFSVVTAGLESYVAPYGVLDYTGIFNGGETCAGGAATVPNNYGDLYVGGARSIPVQLWATYSIFGGYGNPYQGGPFAGTIEVLCPESVSLDTSDIAPTGAVGQPYSGTAIASPDTSAPWTYAITAGSLESGLSLNPATGEISAASASGGYSDFILTATNTIGCSVSAPLTITIGTIYSEELTFETTIPTWSNRPCVSASGAIVSGAVEGGGITITVPSDVPPRCEGGGADTTCWKLERFDFRPRKEGHRG